MSGDPFAPIKFDAGDIQTDPTFLRAKEVLAGLAAYLKGCVCEESSIITGLSTVSFLLVFVEKTLMELHMSLREHMDHMSSEWEKTPGGKQRLLKAVDTLKEMERLGKHINKVAVNGPVECAGGLETAAGCMVPMIVVSALESVDWVIHGTDKDAHEASNND